jgi:hypothetical protein
LKRTGGASRLQHGDDGHVNTSKDSLFHSHARDRLDVPVTADACKGEQQVVRDGQICRHTVISHADECHARSAMPRKVIGKRTDRLTHLLRSITVEGLLALGAIRLQVSEHGLKFFV